MAESPGAPQNVRVNPERASGGNTILWVKWMQPLNSDQFEISGYDITLMAPDIQPTTTTAPGGSVHTLFTVNVNLNDNVQYTATVTARNLCGEIGNPGTFRKFSHLFCIDIVINQLNLYENRVPFI